MNNIAGVINNEALRVDTPLSLKKKFNIYNEGIDITIQTGRRLNYLFTNWTKRYRTSKK